MSQNHSQDSGAGNSNQQTADEQVLRERIERYTNWAGSFVILGFALAVFGIWRFFHAGYQTGSPAHFDLAGLGSFYQGTVASLWSLGALLFVYVGFLGQQLQMLLTERDQKRTGFESVFFNLLTLQRDIVAGCSEGELHGSDCFQRWHRRMTDYFEQNVHSQKHKLGRALTSEEILQEALKAYNQVYELCRGALGHYFRNLYHISKLIERSQLTNENDYSGLLRAQISDFELALLFYNGLTPMGAKFKPLIERYRLLDNLPRDLLLRPEHEIHYAHLKRSLNKK